MMPRAFPRAFLFKMDSTIFGGYFSQSLNFEHIPQRSQQDLHSTTRRSMSRGDQRLALVGVWLLSFVAQPGPSAAFFPSASVVSPLLRNRIAAFGAHLGQLSKFAEMGQGGRREFGGSGACAIRLSTASANSEVLRVLEGGIKAVGVGRKGSKPIPDELVPDLVRIIRSSRHPPPPQTLSRSFLRRTTGGGGETHVERVVRLDPMKRGGASSSLPNDSTPSPRVCVCARA